MPTFSQTTFASFWKRIFQVSQTSNAGVDATTRNVQTGDGVNTSLSISDDVLQVQPQNDDGNSFLVKNSGGNNILAVDTDNSKVLAGESQVAVNTQYAYFGIDNGHSATFSADTHYAIPFQTNFSLGSAIVGMGSSTSSSFNDTNPATSLTISNTAMDVVKMYWYVMDDITIDAVKWLHGADTATGEVTAAHLMSYSVDIGNGSTSGDLSSGVVVAGHEANGTVTNTVTNAGWEQIYYQSLTIQNSDVDAGKVILFTFASDTVNSDYSISANIKYHIR